MSGSERTVVFQLPSVVSGQLACIQGSVAGRSWRLSAGTFVIGRTEGCDLYLPNEPGVSKTHAKIVAEGDHYRLIDAESRNGTIVNGSPVQQTLLRDGDEIQICGCRLRFTQTSGGTSGGGRPVRDEVTAPTFASPPVSRDVTHEGPPPTMSSPGPLSASAEAAPSYDLDDAPGDAPAVHAPTATDTLPSPSAVEIVEVRGSTLPAFFAGLFAVLISGGGAYAALLYTNDGRLPPPADAHAPMDDDGAAAGDPDPAGEGAEGSAEGGGTAAAAGESPDDPSGAKPAEGVGEAPGADATPGPGGAAADDPSPTEVDADEAAADEPDDVDEARAPPTKTPTRAASRRDRRPVETPAAARAAPPQRRARAAPPPAATPAPSGAEPASTDDAAAGDATAATAADPAGKEWAPATYVKPKRVPVRLPAGGRVSSVEVENGQILEKGATLAVLEASGASPADIETKKESIRALKSIVEASGDPEAAKLLVEEQDALAAMQASSRTNAVTAPIGGKLEGFSVKAGEMLRARLVVGFIEPSDEAALVVTVPQRLVARIKVGQTVKVRTPRGNVDGTITGKPRKKGKVFTITVAPVGTADLSDADAVELP